MDSTENHITNAELFEKDDFPGKPRILFVGLNHSTHTHSWIDLLKGAEFNIRLYSSDNATPPRGWDIRTYVTSPAPTEETGEFRKNLYPTASEISKYNEELQRFFNRNLFHHPLELSRRGLNFFASRLSLPELVYDNNGFFMRSLREQWLKGHFSNLKIPYIIPSTRTELETSRMWLAQVIRDWRPDIIQTLGLYDNQGGYYYFKIRKEFGLEGYGKWVLQLRGGSDLTLRRHDPQFALEIPAILRECDHIISDNLINIEYATEMGIPRNKFASIVPVPGTGGINVDDKATTCVIPPSKRRLILVPKAYESIWSKASLIFEGIRLAWDNIQPCVVVFLAINPESRAYFYGLPLNIREKCRIEERLPHLNVLHLLNQARVMLAPSLVDGIPNVLYEAMSCGVFPIVSPLDTIKTVVKNEENALFARNLYPEEIAAALIRAMNDDVLVDRAADKNSKLVRQLADRNKIRQRVIDYYQILCRNGE